MLGGENMHKLINFVNNHFAVAFVTAILVTTFVTMLIVLLTQTTFLNAHIRQEKVVYYILNSYYNSN